MIELNKLKQKEGYEKFSKKESTLEDSRNGEIGVIRNILMGDHISQYESNFKSLRELIENNDQDSNEQLKKMENSFNQRITQLEKSTTDWFDSYEKNMNVRLDKIEKLFEDKIKDLEKKMSEDKTEDRESISEMLSVLSKTIAGKK